MKMYNQMFKHIKPEAIAAVRTTIKSGLFREKDMTIKRNMIILLNNKLCNIYSLPIIKVNFLDNFYGAGHYDRITKEITINKPSLVTFLHEFCHYKQDVTGKSNTEEIARGWSISLYFLSTPKLCTRAIESGKIMHQRSMNELKPVPVEDEEI